LNTKRLVAWIVFLAIFAMAARVSMDTDTWWHIRAGQWIIQNREIPTTDFFSYTRAGETWIYPGWLVEAPMYLLYQLFGPGGLNLWTAAMVTLTFIFIWQTLSGGVFLKAFVIILAASASGVYWAARPYLVSFLLSAVYLKVLEDFRWNRSLTKKSQEEPNPFNWFRFSRQGGFRSLLWLPLLMIVWVNSHGGFVVGFILWGIYWFALIVTFLIQRYVKKSQVDIHSANSILFLSAIGLLMILAVCINPHGLVMLGYPLKTVSIGALQDFIQEWQSPNFHMRSSQPFIWLWILTFAVVGISRRRIALTDFFLFGVFSYMSLLASRNMALFSLVSPIVLTRHASPLISVLSRKLNLRLSPESKPTRGRELINWLLLTIIALSVGFKAFLIFPWAANEKVFRETLPIDAAAHIKSNKPPGRLFNSYNWGGYLIWELPDYPVFVDGRTDLYNDEILDQWLQVVRAEEGWEEVLDQWGVHLMLLEPTMPVVRCLEQNGWELLFVDEKAVIYGR